MAIWITSDLHLNHYNIIKLEHENLVKAGLSHISTIEEYNQMIVKNINSVVTPYDTLYILGDAAFGGTDMIKTWISQIHGYKILLLGNHDRCSREQLLQLGFQEVHSHPMYLPEGCGKVLLSHYPLYEALDNPYIVYNLHGHLHNSKLDLPNFLNVNIAMHKYMPINFKTLLPQIQNGGKNRREKWLQEWYAAHQVFPSPRSDIVLGATGHIDFAATEKITQNH